MNWKIIPIFGVLFLLLIPFAQAKEPAKYMPAFPFGADDFIMYALTFMPSLDLTIKNLVVTGVLTASETHFTNTTVTEINVTSNMTVQDTVTAKYFNGSWNGSGDYILKAGDSDSTASTFLFPNSNWTIDNLTARRITIGDSEGDHHIYFYNSGSATGEFIRWYDMLDWFEISDNVYIDGGGLTVSYSISSGADIFTTGAADDLWLGASAQASAPFKAYADGSLNISSGNFTVDTSGNLIAIGTGTFGNINLGEYIYHDGDADTYIRMEDDSMKIYVGNRFFMYLTEGLQDYIQVLPQLRAAQLTVGTNDSAGSIFHVLSPTFPLALFERTDDRTGDVLGGIRFIRTHDTGLADGAGVAMYFGLDDDNGVLQNTGLFGARWVDVSAKTMALTFNTRDGGLSPGTSAFRRMTILGTGEVGIGTTGPTHLIEGGTSKNSITGSDVDVSELPLFLRNPADDNDEALGIGFGISSNALNVGAAIIHERVGSQSYGKLHFATKPSGAGAGANIPIRMTIDSNGDVGIGTPEPNATLHVLGDFKVEGGIGNFTENATIHDALITDFLNEVSPFTAAGITVLPNVTFKQDVIIEGTLFGGNPDAFTPQYIFAHNNETIPLKGSSVWTNVTFTQEEAEIKEGISHTHNDNTNTTFTINEDGVYDIDYDFDVIDTSASSTDIDVAGRAIYLNGTEIDGSVFETDITKKDIETEISHDFLAELKAGDKIIFQFVADDSDVVISTHGSFGTHPESCTVRIFKIANLP